ncbi:MAG: hypothetical protein CM15mP49_23650 [Actinomycetota bacterium]|nr:MAG: hypothetical protein CM15mP49_23650 [Actinomycetota bacterium]
MGDKFEQLRLSTALAHLIPGAELILRSHDDAEYLVGNHPSADFTLCEMRRLIASVHAQVGLISRSGYRSLKFAELPVTLA